MTNWFDRNLFQSFVAMKNYISSFETNASQEATKRIFKYQ